VLAFLKAWVKREAVEWGWNQEPGKTMFHIVNAYTRAAQFEGLSAAEGGRDGVGDGEVKCQKRQILIHISDVSGIY